MAGDERIELPTVVLETIIIPFNYIPRWDDYNTKILNMQQLVVISYIIIRGDLWELLNTHLKKGICLQD